VDTGRDHRPPERAGPAHRAALRGDARVTAISRWGEAVSTEAGPPQRHEGCQDKGLILRC
jgi:hypothetical protein